MTMVYDDPHETEGIPAVIEDRVSTDASWSGRYRLDSVTVAGADDDMVRVDITPLEEASAGSTLVDERELGPFTWIAAQ